MSEPAIRNLLDRWLKVWHEGALDLVAGCVGAAYVRHEAAGVRTVTPESYRAEIEATRAQFPDIHFEIHEDAVVGDRMWARYTMSATDPETGEKTDRGGLQVDRVEEGKLVETWAAALPPGITWETAAG